MNLMNYYSEILSSIDYELFCSKITKKYHINEKYHTFIDLKERIKLKYFLI